MGGSSSTPESTTTSPATPESIRHEDYDFDEYVNDKFGNYPWVGIAVGRTFVDKTPYSKLSITLPGDEKEIVTYKSYPLVKDFQTPFQSISPESYTDASFNSPFNINTNRREFSASSIDYEKLFSEIYPTNPGFISYPTYGMSSSLVNVDITPFKGMVDAAIANDKAAFLKSTENFWFSDPIRRIVRYNLFNSGILSNFFNRIAVVKNPSQPVWVTLPGGLEVNAVDSATKMPTEITTKYTGDYNRWDYSRFKADFDRCVWSNTEVVAPAGATATAGTSSEVRVKVDFDVCIFGPALYNIFELRLYEISDMTFKYPNSYGVDCHLIVPVLILTQARRNEIIQASLGDRGSLISTTNNEELFIIDADHIIASEDMDLNRIPGINVSSVDSKYYADKTVRTISYKDLVTRYSESIRYVDEDMTCNGLRLRFSDYAVVRPNGLSESGPLYITKKDMRFFNPAWFTYGYMKVLNDNYFLAEMKYIRKFIADNHNSSVEGHIIQSLINELQ